MQSNEEINSPPDGEVAPTVTVTNLGALNKEEYEQEQAADREKAGDKGGESSFVSEELNYEDVIRD